MQYSLIDSNKPAFGAQTLSRPLRREGYPNPLHASSSFSNGKAIDRGPFSQMTSRGGFATVPANSRA
jgi:hypothetical protein